MPCLASMMVACPNAAYAAQQLISYYDIYSWLHRITTFRDGTSRRILRPRRK